jgi:hypothetical protein
MRSAAVGTVWTRFFSAQCFGVFLLANTMLFRKT